jgi:hypothetical protein
VRITRYIAIVILLLSSVPASPQINPAMPAMSAPSQSTGMAVPDVYIYNSAATKMRITLVDNSGAMSLVTLSGHERANFRRVSAVKICTKNHRPCREVRVVDGERYGIYPNYETGEWLLMKLPD